MSGDRPYVHESWLRRKYLDDGLTMAEMADVAGASKATICRWLKRFDVPTRKGEFQKRPYAGFGHKQERQYLYEVWTARDPDGTIRTVRHHRLLATLMVDDLAELDGMHVHHKNGIEWDNRLENLEVVDPGRHRTLHHGTEDAPYRDEAWLREQYLAQRKSVELIADEVGCHGSTVLRWLHRHGIQTRPAHRPKGS